jgi:putative transposase
VTITRSNHCVYDTHYHLVLTVKYRKALLSAAVVTTMRDTLQAVEERYDLHLEQFGDDKNHIHVLLSFHPKYSIGQVVRVFKSIIAKQLFLAHPALEERLVGR